MDIESIRELYNYHYWARDRVLAAVELITADQFTQSTGASFDTLQGTFVHLMNSERLWLNRWLGKADEPALEPRNFSMLNEVRMYWDMIQMHMEKYRKELTPDRLSAVIRYTNLKGDTLQYPLWQMMQQVVLHGVHHRSEAATMLTEFGHAPEPLDLIFYFREKSGQ
ncbi:MAG TPA: DinB family protein [Anaerolineae bacterium]|nr:DinB family protein [Anaerolineae bacterium]